MIRTFRGSGKKFVTSRVRYIEHKCLVHMSRVHDNGSSHCGAFTACTYVCMFVCFLFYITDLIDSILHYYSAEDKDLFVMSNAQIIYENRHILI